MSLGFSKTLEVELGRPTVPQGIEVPEQFRAHVARELHDQVAQPLIALVLRIHELRVGVRPEPAEDDLASIEDAARSVLRQTREMLVDLRGREHIRINFTQALRSELPVLHGCESTVHITSRWPRRINGWAAFNLQRIVQQAVVNASRHGHARNIRIFLDVNAAREAVVAIVDDGIGIQESPAGFGMAGMRERAAILGGEFSAEANSTGGTRIEVRMPRTTLE